VTNKSRAQWPGGLRCRGRSAAEMVGANKKNPTGGVDVCLL
jgi:hypothetical protein